MSRSRLVLDTSPLVFLAKIAALPILPRLAAELIAPAAVVGEIRAGRGRGPDLELPEAVPGLRVEPDLPLVPEIAGWDLGAGESQVLAQVLSRPGWEAVLDDAEARRSPLIWAIMVLVLPACEELLFRGALYGGLRRLLHPAAAVGASALILENAAVPQPVAV